MVKANLSGLKTVITSEGLWRIKRPERGQAIEVEQLTSLGHGGILSEDFVTWRASTDQSANER